MGDERKPGQAQHSQSLTPPPKVLSEEEFHDRHTECRAAGLGLARRAIHAELRHRTRPSEQTVN